MIVLPIAGGHGGVVISQKAADMYIASATTRTGYVARGIAGKDAASSVDAMNTALQTAGSKWRYELNGALPTLRKL